MALKSLVLRDLPAALDPPLAYQLDAAAIEAGKQCIASDQAAHGA